MMNAGTKPPQRQRPVAGDPGRDRENEGTKDRDRKIGIREKEPEWQDEGREQRRCLDATGWKPGAGNQKLAARSWRLFYPHPPILRDPTPHAVLRNCESVKLWSLYNQWLAATVSQSHSPQNQFLIFRRRFVANSLTRRLAACCLLFAGLRGCRYFAVSSGTATAYGGSTPYSAAMRKNPRNPSTHSSSST